MDCQDYPLGPEEADYRLRTPRDRAHNENMLRSGSPRRSGAQRVGRLDYHDYRQTPRHVPPPQQYQDPRYVYHVANNHNASQYAPTMERNTPVYTQSVENLRSTDNYNYHSNRPTQSSPAYVDHRTTTFMSPSRSQRRYESRRTVSVSPHAHSRSTYSPAMIESQPVAPSIETDPSFKSNSGVPFKGAATTDFTRTSIPKNFEQPLTCFYWHQNGFCNKTDSECLYAHYFTGVVAAAPVKIRGYQAGPTSAVAGRNAVRYIKHVNESEESLSKETTNSSTESHSLMREKQYEAHEKENALNELDTKLGALKQRLTDKEDILKGLNAHLQRKEAQIQEKEANPKSALSALEPIFSQIAKEKTAAAEKAIADLTKRRVEIENIRPHFEHVDTDWVCKSALMSIDDAIAALTHFEKTTIAETASVQRLKAEILSDQ